MKIDFSDKIKKLRDQQVAYEAKMKKDGKKFVNDAIKTFFAAHPQVEALQWTQYTPFFNDGDECVFGLSGEVLVKFPGDDTSGDHSDGFLGEYNFSNYVSPANQREYRELCSGSATDYDEAKKLHEKHPHADSTLVQDLNSFYRLLDHALDFLKFTFGDHCKVTATPEEITVSEYAHD